MMAVIEEETKEEYAGFGISNDFSWFVAYRFFKDIAAHLRVTTT